MAAVSANGITIEYEAHGEGDPLLLVMGLSGQLTDWPAGFVDELTGRGFRVIRFDNRDIGLSTEFTATPPTTGQIAKAVLARRPLAAEYRISDMAADAAGLLDALGIGRAHVVGMSMGGMIAQALAIDHAPCVGSITSIMSTTGNRRVGQPKLSLVRQFARRPVPTRATAVDQGVETVRAISGPSFDESEARALVAASVERSFRPAGVARQTAAIVASPDRTAGLRRLEVPALVIHGLIDPLVRLSGGIATAAAIPDSRLLVFNDMAHDLPRTRWSEMADAIAHNVARAA